jgi:hypothetical protein
VDADQLIDKCRGSNGKINVDVDEAWIVWSAWGSLFIQMGLHCKLCKLTSLPNSLSCLEARARISVAILSMRSIYSP